MAWSSLGIYGIVLIVIGLIMGAIAGGFLISNSTTPKSAYIWILFFVGFVFLIVGGIMLFIELYRQDTTVYKCGQAMEVDECGQPLDTTGNVVQISDVNKAAGQCLGANGTLVACNF